MEFQVGNNVEHSHEVPSRNLLIEADSGCVYFCIHVSGVETPRCNLSLPIQSEGLSVSEIWTLSS